MKVNENDYVICKDPQNPKRNYMMKVVRVGDEKIGGILEHDRHLKEEKMVSLKTLVVANLGQAPAPGKYAGVDARDIYRKTLNHDAWGKIHFFVKPSKPLRKALARSLDKTAEKLTKIGFEHLFNNVCNEVRAPHGKYAGYYKHGGKGKPNRLALCLKEEHAEQMDNVLYHECGHVIRFNYIKNPRLRAKWLWLFDTSVPTEKVKKFDRMFNSIEKAQPETLKEYAAQLEDEDHQRTLKTVVRYLRQVHRVSAKDVNVLLEAGKYDQLQELWPTGEIDVSGLAPIVSDYATKNVEELFAESFAFYMTKKKLPKDVLHLLEKSLSYAKDVAKNRGEKDDEEEEE